MSFVAPRFASPPPVYGSDPLNAPQAHFTSLKPYLTLPYLLSLTWLATPITSLLFIIFRLIISQGAAQDGVEDAKGVLIASCAAAERAAQHCLTALQGIIEFVIDMYRSIFLCFLELVVRGGLAIIIGALTEVTNFLQNTVNGLKTSIQGDIQSANNAIASAVNAINSVTRIVNVKLDVPQFSIPALSGLDNIKIPTDLQDALTKLNSTLPTLDQLRDTVDNIIAIPFNELKKEINETFTSPAMRFNTSVLAVPARSNIQFCNELDTSIVDDLGRDLRKIGRIGIIILLLALVLLILGAMAVEWYKWRVLQGQLERTREAWSTDSNVQDPQLSGHQGVPMMVMSDDNLMLLHATQQHPLLSALANRLANALKLSVTSYTHLRFFFAYVFHPAALACLLIGLFGLISVQIQLAAIGPVQKHFSSQVSNSVSDFTNNIALSINGAMREDSAAYAAQVNAQTSAMQSTINDNLFGWVNGTTVTLNNTLVAFYDDIQSTVELVFGGTILETPAREFIRCLIGSKVQGIENALTFIHDNLKVNMPTVSDDVLLLSNSSVNEITQPISLAAVGDGKDDGSGSGIVGKVIARYIASLEKERIMFLIFLGLWALVVVIALCIILWHTIGARWLHEHRQRAWQNGQSFGPFSRRPSEQSRYAFPNVPGGSPFGTLHARPLEGETEKGFQGGLKRLFSSPPRQEQQAPSPKWEEGQRVHTMIHIQGGDNWVGRLKSALARRKDSKNAMVDPYAVPPQDPSTLNRSGKVNPGALTDRPERVLSSTWSVSPTAPPARPWLSFKPKTSPTPEVVSPTPVKNEVRESVDNARPVPSVLPAHAYFSTRSPSPPTTPPGLSAVPLSPTPSVGPANAYLARQVPPLSTIPGGRIPQASRHRAQMSTSNVNPFSTPFDDPRTSLTIEARQPNVGRAF
ncbi:Plasma membrane fusion protein PRM1 [Coprinopsis cinerea okayama7|uniref:Plasma membrane fusion protein PRM1 n=1 Tax=Rhizoctonia solani TaxID=456999 RepID=A0A0K6G8W5_9AGAM|nr:Plasma membrane fusion protein PRM1 [Coprinopsis cinerea okayama7\